MFVSAQGKKRITELKARAEASKVKRKKKPLEWRALQRVADALQPVLRANLRNGIISFQKEMNLAAIQEAVQSRHFAKIENLINWDSLDDKLKKAIERDFQVGVVRGARASEPFFRKAVDRLIPQLRDVSLPFTLQNPAIQAKMKAHLATLRTQIKGQSKKAVNSVLTEINRLIGRSWERAMPPRSTAKLIKRSIGLNDKQAKALTNYEFGLRNKIVGPRSSAVRQGTAFYDEVRNVYFVPSTIKENQINKMVGGYSDRLLKDRATMIANTETISAVNIGQKALWQQAEESGFIVPGSKKKWITTPDDLACDSCLNLNRQMVNMSENFDGGDFGSVDSPPLHPNCRCAMELVMDEKELDREIDRLQREVSV